MRNKRLRVFSITGLVAILILFTFPNLSWTAATLKTDSSSLANNIKDSLSTSDSLVKIAETSPSLFLTNYITDIYNTIGLQQTGLALPVFEKAITGFVNLKSKNRLNKGRDIITVVDFTKSSKEKRMWIIDLKNETVLLNTYVAHGRGSGDDMATAFSNISQSNQSSLGFYVTNETYHGKHGLSLRLDGFDTGINNMARARAIVVHGADYVSESFIAQHGRLGRSQGCPAVPAELSKTVINLIKDKTCLFINGNSSNYTSNLLNISEAAQSLMLANNS